MNATKLPLPATSEALSVIKGLLARVRAAMLSISRLLKKRVGFMKTGSLWTLNRYQLLGVLSYSAMFAVLNETGGVWTDVSVLGWAPFLPVAYVTGSLGASVAERGFLVGAVIGIAIQTWALLSVWVAWRRWRARR